MSGNAKPKKYDIDLSASFYPYLSSKKAQSLFCVSAVLVDDVNKELLCRAVNEVADRFPTYKVRLKKGYGKYYFEENRKPVLVFEWNGHPQTPIDVKVTNGYVFRFSYKGRRVYLEMFHALSDANGAMRFLLAALRRYRELTGVHFDETCAIPNAREEAPSAELEDGFIKNYTPISLSKLNLKAMAGDVPHRIVGTPLKDGYTLDEAMVKTDDMLDKAKAIDVSFTAYLAGVAAYAIAHSAEVKKAIVIMVPVNLRNLFPSVTAQNFITFVRLVLKAEDCMGVEACAKICAEQLKEKAAKENMSAFISTTVRAQRSLLFRIMPLFVKWLSIRIGKLFMKSRQTIIVSNLGDIKTPDGLGVERLALFLNVSKNNVHNLAAVSNSGVCTLAVTNAIEERTLPSKFFDTLKEL